MKTLTVHSIDLESLNRLDAYFHLSDGRRLARHVSTGAIQHLGFGAEGGLKAKVWMPGRLKHVYAVTGEKYLPYLRPSDTLNYLPRAADHISESRTPNIDSYKIIPGMILITRSGRNLGPVIYVDEYLSRFALSDDMLRVNIDNETMRFYCLGLLSSPTGQKMLRKNKSGSVIDHITVDHVTALDVPMLGDGIVKDIAARMKKAVTIRESARLKLADLEEKFEATLPPMPKAAKKSLGWTISSQCLSGIKPSHLNRLRQGA